jgi:LPPG:FO 2-phospho-L-lactate transferase
MADACLSAIGVETSAVAVARHYGARRNASGGDGGGLLDGWLVDDLDRDAVPELALLGIETVARPLLMTDLDTTQAIASAGLDLAEKLRR